MNSERVKRPSKAASKSARKARFYEGVVAVLDAHAPCGCILTVLFLVLACSPSDTPRTVAESAGARASRLGAPTPPPPPGSLDLTSLSHRGALGTLPLVRISTPHEPISNGPARFEGYPVESVLQLLVSKEQIADPKTRLRFHLADGRTRTVDADALRDGGGILAVRDLDAPRGRQWRAHPRGQFEMTPGPFYLVWETRSGDERHPWIAQVERISMETVSAMDSPAFPRHAPTAEPGFHLFAKHCLACHSINLSGGRLGPELNVPLSVMETMPRAVLRTYIRSPRAVRATATMPDFISLTDDELDDLVEYLHAMRLAKVCATQIDCARFRGQ